MSLFIIVHFVNIYEFHICLCTQYKFKGDDTLLTGDVILVYDYFCLHTLLMLEWNTFYVQYLTCKIVLCNMNISVTIQ